MRGLGKSNAIAAISILGFLLACGAEDSNDQTADADNVATDSVAEPPLFEPEVPTVTGEGEPRLFRVLLVNASDVEAHVFATAGAARVVLDTVPGQDSLHVDIRVRADRVDLEAEDGSGRLLKRETLELEADSLTRWVIGSPTVSLVTPLGRDYPRTRPTRPAKRR